MTPHDHPPPGPAPGAEPAGPAPYPTSYSRSGSQKRRRKNSLQVALDDDELATVKESAARTGLALSSYGRVALLGTPGPRAKRKPHVQAELLGQAMAQLKRSGNVLNQMQHSLNAGAAIILGRECSEALAANRRAADAILEAVGRKERDDDNQGEPA
jgi:hypothetical protein